MSHKSIARALAGAAYNWVIGGYENSILDGHINEMPPAIDLLDEVYSNIWNEPSATDGLEIRTGYTIEELRSIAKFAGRDYIKGEIAKLLEEDGYKESTV